MGLTTLCMTLSLSVSAMAAGTANYAFEGETGTAEVHGTAAYSDGKVGKAFQFNGTDTYLTVPSDLITDNFTFAAWVYPEGDFTANTRIFDFGTKEAANGLFFVNYKFSDKKLELTSNIKGNWAGFTEDGGLKPNEWTHVAVTLKNNGDGTTTGTMYINGVAQSGSLSTAGKLTDIPGDNMYIGKSNWDADPLFKGLMDEITIADKAMTADEIKALLDKTAAPAADAPAEAAQTETTANPATGDAGVLGYAAVLAVAGLGMFFFAKKKITA